MYSFYSLLKEWCDRCDVNLFIVGRPGTLVTAGRPAPDEVPDPLLAMVLSLCAATPAVTSVAIMLPLAGIGEATKNVVIIGEIAD